MKTILFLIFIIISFEKSICQPELKWLKTYDGGSYEVARKITRDSENNIIITGISVASITTYTDYQIVTIKYDSFGHQKWIKKRNNPEGTDDIGNLFTDDSCNIYIGGMTADKFFLMKYDSDGNEKWIKLFGDSFPVAFGGGFILSKNHIFYDKKNELIYYAALSYSNNKTQSCIAKFNTNGKLFWERSYPTLNMPVSLLGDENFIYLCGHTAVSDTNTDLYIQKTDTAGNPIWLKEYDGGFKHADRAIKAMITSANEILFTGVTYFPYKGKNIFLIKLDSNGTKIWNKNIDGGNGLEDFPNDLIIDSIGNAYLTGSTHYFVNSINTSSKFFTIKVNANGESAWFNTFGEGLSEGNGIQLQLDSKNNIYAVGMGSNYDLATVKYDTAGNRKWFFTKNFKKYDFGLNFIIDREDNLAVLSTSNNNFMTMEYYTTLEGDITNVGKLTSDVQNFELYQNYPNPFNPSTTISYQIPEGGLVILKIYNVLGEEIATLVNDFKSKGRYNVRFDASNLPSGIYIYQLKASNFQSSKKLLLLK